MPFATVQAHSNGLSPSTLELDYESFGNPTHPAVVFVMGLGTQRTAWPLPMVHALVNAGFRVVTFDNRDIGLSSKLPQLGLPNVPWNLVKAAVGLPVKAPYSLADMAGDTLALMDQLGIAKAHIVGASMGGMIAQWVTLLAPERVLSLTSIMSTTGRRGLPGPTAAAGRRLMSKPPKHATVEQLARHFFATYRVIGTPQSNESDQDLYNKMLASVTRGYHPAGTARQLLAVVADGSRAQALARITTPTLVIHGSADPLIPMAGGLDTVACIPGARWAPIAGMGHDFAPSILPAVTDALRQFLVDQPRP